MAKPFASLYRILLLISTALLACILIFICLAYFFLRETDPLLGALEHEQIIAYLRTDNPKHLPLFLHQAHSLGILQSAPEDLELPQASSYSMAIIKRNEGIAWIAASKLPIVQEHVRSSDPELTKTTLATALHTQFPLHSFKTSIPRTAKSLWIHPDFFASLPASHLRDIINALLRETESIAVTWGNERTIITLQGLNVDLARLPIHHPLSLPQSECQVSIAEPQALLVAIIESMEKEDPTLALGIRGVLDAKWKENVPGTVSTTTIAALLHGPLSLVISGSGRTLLGVTQSPQTLEAIFSAYQSNNVPIIKRHIRLSKEYTWTDLILDPQQQEVHERKIGSFIVKERMQTRHPIALAYSVTGNTHKRIPYVLSNSGSLLSPLFFKEKPLRRLTSLAYGRCAMKDIIKEVDGFLPFLLLNLPIDLKEILLSLEAHTFEVHQSSNGLRIVIENS